ncbi:hypothetical protein Hanom_Chr03g00199281 [Helianthus anomalus]
MGVDEDSINFGFEEELNNIDISQPEAYMFKDIPNANNIDDLVVEDDSDNDECCTYSGEGSEDFPTF